MNHPTASESNPQDCDCPNCCEPVPESQLVDGRCPCCGRRARVIDSECRKCGEPLPADEVDERGYCANCRLPEREARNE